jgi:two-component system response regulator RstA
VRPLILVVDDNTQLLEALVDRLEAQGWRVSSCADARQAVLQAEALRPALIVTDIMMPGYGTGLDAYRALRGSAELPKDLPVIFLTGLRAEEIRAAVPLEDPRVRLLHKPAAFSALLAAVRELIGDPPKTP